MGRLVIGRAYGERVRLRWSGGPDVWLYLLKPPSGGGDHRIVFEAPREEVVITREELLESQEEEASRG